MLKKILFGMSALAMFAACTEDYTDWAEPQTNEPVEAQTVEVKVTPQVTAATAVDLDTDAETINLFTPNLPENAKATAYTVKLTDTGTNKDADGNELKAKYADYKIQADEAGNIKVADLQKATTEMYNMEAVERTFNATIITDLTVEGKTGAVAVSTESDPFVITVKPKAPDFNEFIYERGTNTSWGDNPACPLYSEELDGKYVGFMYLDGEFKFMPNANNWDGDWESDGEGKIADNGGSNCPAPETPGFFVVNVDLVKMTYTLTPIEFIDIVGGVEGGASDWSDGPHMTYNKEKGCWEADVTFTGAFKFRGNGTWSNDDGNFGGTLDNILNGSNDNLTPSIVNEPVHVKLFISCNTKSHAEITKLGN